MTSFKRPIEPYIVPIADAERTSYQRLRIPAAGGDAPRVTDHEAPALA
jgi:hypothetical protein